MGYARSRFTRVGSILRNRSAIANGCPGRLALLVAVGLLACGDGTGPTPPPPPPPPAVLSFAAIAGEWVGTVSQPIHDRIITYQAKLVFADGAVRNAKVGTSAYSDVDDPADPGRVLDCGGDLSAQQADGSLYEVTERITFGRDQCADGVIRLRHCAGTAG